MTRIFAGAGVPILAHLFELLLEGYFFRGSHKEN
jgi:hypothetical protein